MQLRNIDKRQYIAFQQLCKLSKNMYNVALYNVRQYYFQEHKYLSYESNYHLCKSNENYKLLNTDIAQQTMRIVDRSFKSFFALIKKAKDGNYRFKDIQLPHYLDKESYFTIIIPRFKINNNKVAIPMSLAFKKEFGELSITVPPKILNETIKEIRIHPKHNCRYFEVEFVYLKDIIQNVNKETVLSIDFGLDNLATCVTSTGASFIMDGKRLKSFNQWYNKENARLQSIKDKARIKHLTHKQSNILRRRNSQVQDYLNKVSKYIVKYCDARGIGTIVVGYNPTIKQRCNLGKVNNQNFLQIPIANLKEKIKMLCEVYNIKFVEQEESYTSKASALDLDEIPQYNQDNPQKYSFSGKRISRGQYRSSYKVIINADLNGALNILRKSNQVSVNTLLSRGHLAWPLRIRIN